MYEEAGFLDLFFSFHVGEGRERFVRRGILLILVEGERNKKENLGGII